MKTFVPEISWHNRLPALALDISNDAPDNQYRVATGGNDCRVYIWLINIDANNKNSKQQQPSTPVIQIKAGLRRHQKSIGAVRFSPLGNILASGDDDGYIYIWKHNIELEKEQEHQFPNESNAFLNDDGFEDIELWQQQRVLRGHIEDICDLAWSKDGQYLLSGSVDNSAILWDTVGGNKVWCSDLIKGYVQGVAIDPHTQFMAAISSDRALRVINFLDKKVQTTRRMEIKGKFKAFFCDDTVKTFCRRFEFSPDGQFLLAPTSRLIEIEPKTVPTNNVEQVASGKESLPTSEKVEESSPTSENLEESSPKGQSKSSGVSLLAKKTDIEMIQIDDSNEENEKILKESKPSTNDNITSSVTIKTQPEQQAVQQQPTPSTTKKCIQALLVFRRSSFSKPTHYYPTGEVALCARFSPTVYKLKEDATNFWDIPYRIVFAVATTRNVIIYDSQQSTPLGYISQIHLARITDLAWSKDGRLLMVTSYDGYSTIITFEPGEFGEIYTGPLIEPFIKPVVDEVKTTEDNLNENGKSEEKPTKKGQKRMKAPKETAVAAKKEKLNTEPDQESEEESKASKDAKPPKKATPKKITPTRLPESATMWRFLRKV